MRKYINTAFIYAMAAMAAGVYYREITRISGFTGTTSLAFVHLHLFVLGAMMFMIIALFSRVTDVENEKSFRSFYVLYNIALPFMAVMFLVRGTMQVVMPEISSGLSAAVSGTAGISHILMLIAVIQLFRALKRAVADR